MAKILERFPEREDIEKINPLDVIAKNFPIPRYSDCFFDNIMVENETMLEIPIYTYDLYNLWVVTDFTSNIHRYKAIDFRYKVYQLFTVTVRNKKVIQTMKMNIFKICAHIEENCSYSIYCENHKISFNNMFEMPVKSSKICTSYNITEFMNPIFIRELNSKIESLIDSINKNDEKTKEFLELLK